MAKCPKCGAKLHWYDFRAECKHCGVNIPNYKWEERLEMTPIRPRHHSQSCITK